MKPASLRLLAPLLALASFFPGAHAQVSSDFVYPVVRTGPITNLTKTSATLGVYITGVTKPTTVQVSYGLTTAYGTTLVGPTVTEDGIYGIPVEGLIEFNPYQFRGEAIVDGVLLVDANKTFAYSPPPIFAKPATNITDSAATLNARVFHVTDPTDIYFEYGPSDKYGRSTGETTKVFVTSVSADTDVSLDLTGLTNEQYYTFQAISVVDGHSQAGGWQTFLCHLDIIPRPASDQYTITSAGPRELDVLANDTDPQNDPLTIVGLISQPTWGTAVISGNKIIYTPDAIFDLASPTPNVPRDRFSYRVQNSRGATSAAMVELFDEPGFWSIPTTPEPAAAVPGRLSGSMQGLLSANAHHRAGLLRLTVNAGGHFTGTYKENGATVPLSGALNDQHAAITAPVRRGPLQGLRVAISYDASLGRLTATSNDGTGAVAVDLRGVQHYTAQAPTPHAGRYKILLSPDSSVDAALGNSGAILVISKLGSCTIAGRLSDQRPFSTSSALSGYDENAVGLACYSAAYQAAPGYVAGPLLFASSATSLAGELDWLKPTLARGPMDMRPGFQTTIAVNGSYLSAK